MLLPIGDEPNPRHFPVMTVALIVVNVAAYLLVALPLSMQRPDPGDPLLAEYLRAVLPHLPPGTSPQDVMQQITAYDLVVYRWGFRPNAPSPVTLLTAMFLHGGLMHLFGNMLYLWIYGNNVEDRLGKAAYLFWYLATGIAATLFFMAFNLGSPLPLVGASGAISGVLGFYFVWFPRNIVKLWIFLFPFYMGVVRVRATYVLVVYLVLDNLLPFLLVPAGGGGVAHGAHIGGFIAGALVALILGRTPSRGPEAS
ncbi:MAG TPA: rhomboid family intramembrane serine protease [Burkholderiales bacterium]|nr:rhomboid family intramembrane serine protease [Burkholderiales bacterium]